MTFKIFNFHFIHTRAPKYILQFAHASKMLALLSPVNCHENITKSFSLFEFSNNLLNNSKVLSLSVNQSSCSLTVAKSFRSEVLCIACFAVDFSIFLRLSGRLQTLPTFGTAKAVLMPRLPSAHHLLRRIHTLSTARALLRAAELLGKLGRVWVGGGSVSLGFFRFDAQPLAAVHVECSCSLTVSVSLWSVLFPVAGFAVDFLLMDGQCGAV